MTKKLFTSYYAKSATNPKAYATSSKIPAYYNNLRVFHAVAPTWEMVLAHIKEDITWDQYIDQYMDLLINVRKLKAENIVDIVEDGSIFLCYEKSEDMNFCHRRLLAKWIEDETGVPVPELDWDDGASDTDSLIVW